MRLIIAGVTLTLWLVYSPVAAEAQAEKVPRVGFLCWVTCGDAYHDAFWQALRSLGYADYKNIAFEYRAAGGDDALLDTLAIQLVDLKPAVIVADTTQSARALKKATETIALVVIADDPVGSGFISNLARPEGNVTGLSLVAVELVAKQLQLLEEAVPGASRVAVLGNPANPATALRLRALQAAARASGVRLLPLDVRTPPEHVNAFAVMAQMHADALIDILGGADRSNSATTGRVIQLTMSHRLSSPPRRAAPRWWPRGRRCARGRRRPTASAITAPVLAPMPGRSVRVPAATRASTSPGGSSATTVAALRKALTLLGSASERSIR